MGTSLFNYDNPFWQFMSRAWDLLLLNFLCILCCLPVITAGASLSSLYYVTLKMIEGREGRIYRNFFKAFRQNFFQCMGIEAVFLAVGAILYLDLRFFGSFGENGLSAGILKGPGAPAGFLVWPVLGAVFLLWAMTLLYVFAVQARFFNPIRRTVLNSFLMSVRHLPSTLAMFALDGIFLALLAVAAPWLAFWCLTAPAYINSWFFCRIFKKYMISSQEE